MSMKLFGWIKVLCWRPLRYGLIGAREHIKERGWLGSNRQIYV